MQPVLKLDYLYIENIHSQDVFSADDKFSSASRITNVCKFSILSNNLKS